jgi:hypothetical protein
VAEAKLRIAELTCRGPANLLVHLLDRDDLHRVPGCAKVEAWPNSGIADSHVTYDPSATDEAAIKRVVTEPYYDGTADTWRMSSFQIEGYDPLDPGLESQGSSP